MRLPRVQRGLRAPGLRLHLIVALVAMTLLPATSAFADATLFLSSTTTPAHRPGKGLALGVSLVVVGFEFEFADASESLEKAAPSLRTGMGNMLLQTPFPVAGMQFYVTTGAGLYRERFGARQETHVGLNTGGGAKITLLGPIRARLDYRVLKLRGEPLHSTVHRFYAGLNLAF